MTTIVFLATAWGSKYGGINVVNLELTRALAEVLGSTGRVLCVVPHAETTETADAKAAGGSQGASARTSRLGEDRRRGRGGDDTQRGGAALRRERIRRRTLGTTAP